MASRAKLVSNRALLVSKKKGHFTWLVAQISRVTIRGALLISKKKGHFTLLVAQISHVIKNHQKSLKSSIIIKNHQKQIKIIDNHIKSSKIIKIQPTSSKIIEVINKHEILLFLTWCPPGFFYRGGIMWEITGFHVCWWIWWFLMILVEF